MTRSDLDFLKKWFSGFCKSFCFPNAEEQKNISLKIEHTYNVCKNIKQILAQNSEHRTQNTELIAETIALFHDVGRFPQYARYKTFKDNVSINHGLLGVKTLLERKVLQRLPEDEQNLIIQSVRFHNTFKVPHLQDETTIFFIKLIRDADKLDIWRVFIEYYEIPEKQRSSVISHGLPDSSQYSHEVLSAFKERRIVSYTTLKTLCDFKLVQLAWVYDLNFKGSFKLLLERDYIKKIAATLPRTDEIRDTVDSLLKYVQQRADSHDS